METLECLNAFQSFFVINGKETLFQDGKASLLAFYKILRLMKFL